MTEAQIGFCELPLFVWLSPSFPVGAFAYSHGLEWAVEAGDVRDAASLREWISGLLTYGSARNDAIIAAGAWRAANLGDLAELCDVNDLALALSPGRERYLEVSAQGNAFVIALREAWPCAMLNDLSHRREDIAYCVAVATVAAHHGLGLRATLESYLLAFASALVSAAVRLGPIGQTDGQRILAALMPVLRTAAAFAETSILDDLGGSTLRSDIAAMKHETQYSRLFRS